MPPKTKAPPTKDAVVFLLDSSPSMNTPYGDDNHNNDNDDNNNDDESKQPSTTTRLDCAKKATISMLGQLMLQSKQNEACVLVLRTATTQHAFDQTEYPNIVDLSGCGVHRPSLDLLRKVQTIQTTTTTTNDDDDNNNNNITGGDICAGIEVAHLALKKKTYKKRFNRRIVLLTDATHKMDPSRPAFVEALQEFRNYEDDDSLTCTLVIFGLDFSIKSVEFEMPASEEEQQQQQQQNDQGGEEMDVDEEGSDEEEEGADGSGNENEEEEEEEESKSDDGGESEDDDDDEEEEEISAEEIKAGNEQFLVSVARQTGGAVKAAKTMQEILDATRGRRTTKSARFKFQFHIAPGISFEARYSKLVDLEKIKSLKYEAIRYDEKSGKQQMNSLGEIVTEKIEKQTLHLERPPEGDTTIDRDTNPLDEMERGKAYLYGKDVIPWSELDDGYTTQRSETCIRIIGYVDQDAIPRSLMTGPTHGISGADSRRACGAISALAQALQTAHQAAIATFVKRKDSDPVLVALFPLFEPGMSLKSYRLFVITLPYKDDVAMLDTDVPLEEEGGATSVCDDLIDSMMLEPNQLSYQHMANPVIRSYNRTVMEKAIDPKSPTTVEVGPSQQVKEIQREVLKKSKTHLSAFRKACPLEKLSAEERKGNKKNPNRSEHYDRVVVVAAEGKKKGGIDP